MVLKCWYCKKQIYTDNYYRKFIWRNGREYFVVTLHWSCVSKILQKYDTTVVTLDILEKEGII